MSKEQQELLDEANNNYLNKCLDKKWMKENFFFDGNSNHHLYLKEEFINKCKTDKEFSEKWGLKIEERELSLEEKEWQLEKTNCINDIENDRIIYGHDWEKYIQEQYEGIQSSQGRNIPTKLITVTYKDKTIENYE